MSSKSRRQSGSRSIWREEYRKYRTTLRLEGKTLAPGDAALPTMLRLRYGGILRGGQPSPRSLSSALVRAASAEDGELTIGPANAAQSTEASAPVTPVALHDPNRRTEWFDDFGPPPFFSEWQMAEPVSCLGGRRPTAVVTGVGPGGIGAATVQLLALRHFRVICCDRYAAPAQAVIEAVRRAGGEVWFVEADVSTEAGVQAVFDEVARRADTLDALVCNAGSAGDPKDDHLMKLTREHLHRLIDDNLLSALLPCTAALRRFFVPQGRGAVVFLGSNNGQRSLGVIGQPGYGMAKAALSALQANLVAGFGRVARFNTVRAGVVKTESRNWGGRLESDPNWPRYEGCYSPSGRLGTPEDIAQVIAFLIGDQAAWINGAEIAVDGGVAAAGIQFPAWDYNNFRASYVGSVKEWLQAQPLSGHKAA